MLHEDDYRRRVCPQCGKEFTCFIKTWVYCRQPNGKERMFFCSWSCLNAYDQERAKTRRKPGRKPRAELEETDGHT